MWQKHYILETLLETCWKTLSTTILNKNTLEYVTKLLEFSLQASSASKWNFPTWIVMLILTYLIKTFYPCSFWSAQTRNLIMLKNQTNPRNSLNVMYVSRNSPQTTWKFIKESTLEKSLMRANFVTSDSLRLQAWHVTEESTLVKSLTNVKFVTNSLELSPLWKCTEESTLEESLMRANFVTNDSLRLQAWHFTEEFTLVRDLMNVMFVTIDLELSPLWKCTEEFTQERSPMFVNTATQNSLPNPSSDCTEWITLREKPYKCTDEESDQIEESNQPSHVLETLLEPCRKTLFTTILKNKNTLEYMYVTILLEFSFQESSASKWNCPN